MNEASSNGCQFGDTRSSPAPVPPAAFPLTSSPSRDRKRIDSQNRVRAGLSRSATFFTCSGQLSHLLVYLQWPTSLRETRISKPPAELPRPSRTRSESRSPRGTCATSRRVRLASGPAVWEGGSGREKWETEKKGRFGGWTDERSVHRLGEPIQGQGPPSQGPRPSPHQGPQDHHPQDCQSPLP